MKEKRELNLAADQDVLAVVTFMQDRIAANRLVAVAQGIAEIAPLLWKQYSTEGVQVLSLSPEPIDSCVEQTQSTAT